jgi:MYXO-CTERM domain-containing protein
MTREAMTTRGLLVALCVAIVWGAAGLAEADIIAKDSFLTGGSDYTAASSLDTQNPSNNGSDRIGWSGAWSGSSVYEASASGLDYAAATYETGGSVSLAVSSGAGTVSRSIGAYTPSSTYYFSGMIVNSGVDTLIGSGNRSVVHFSDSGATDGTGVAFGFWGDGSYQMDCVFRYDDDTTGVTNQVLVNGATKDKVYYFIMKAEVGGGGSTLSVWLNPTDISSESAATSTAEASSLGLSASSAAFGSTIEKLVFEYTNFETAFSHTYDLDEPRFGTTWGAVTGTSTEPVAEPAGLGIVGLALLGLKRRRRD